MFIRKLVLFVLFFTLCLKAFPSVFIVTSNANSGPGTLREALTLAAANGSAVTDYINFNLADQSITGRTITLITKLPDVSSNLVIDGSTQQGSMFGVSTAKILLLFNAPAQDDFAGLSLINQSQIQIYGLYLKSLTDFSTHNLYPAKGFKIVNSNNVQIGDVNKGNVVSGFTVPLSENLRLTNDSASHTNYGLILKSNFFGIESDGQTISPFNDSNIAIDNVFDKITLGGTTAEGNLFATGLSIDYDADNIPISILLKNNKIGVNYDITQPITICRGIIIETSDPNSINVDIEDNVICYQHGFADIYCVNLSGQINILRNYIGVNRNKQKLQSMPYGIFVTWCNQIQIGSTNTNDANYIGYCDPIYTSNCQKTSFNKNSIFCKNTNIPIYQDSYGQTRPQCNILKVQANSVSGTATPNSSIELFYSDICHTCSPQTYFTSTTADANGNWIYNGPITGTVIASATINNSTSEFTQTSINTDNIQIINACNSNGLGSIKGAVPNSATNIQWIDENGKIVGTTADLLNVKPGKYKLVVQNGDCSSSSSYYEINTRFQVDISNINLVNPSCGNSLGAISGVNIINNASDQPMIIWKDAGGNIIGNNLNLQNVPAGSYYLSITSSDQTCSQTFGPFVLKNLTGPNIDQSHASIISTNCGQSTGSITNFQVTGSGTLKYSWLNDQQQQVATTKDLIGQPAGTYKLQVTDDSQCGPIFSNDIQIPETNGISLDESKVQTTVAACGMNNGTITGIQVTGTAQYKWVDANNNVATTTLDVKNVASGDYTFTAYNNSGCSKTSKTYHVGMQAVTQYPSYTVNTIAACPGQSDGSIIISVDAFVASLRWVNSQGQNIGSSQILGNVSKGTYQLYFTDVNGCETLYNSYMVAELPSLTITSQGQVNSDQCGLKTGAINNVAVIGGQSPYTYTWTDGNGNQIGTGSSISNLAAGDYHLNVADSRCGSLTINYTVTSQSAYVAAPPVSDVQLCSSGDAFVSVNNPSSTFTYRLYDDPNSSQPLDEEKSGRFKITVNNNRNYFISQLNGTCESTRAAVKVTVGLSGVNIPNAFTPNGDGINDYWSLKGMENNPNGLVQVFTRYGQKIFESKGYDHPFDGTYGGKELPPGVYYYIINLGTNCNILSGNVTIIR